MGILPRIGIFQRSSIKVFSDGLLNYPAGHCYEIMILA
jgi:hypothetical protein